MPSKRKATPPGRRARAVASGLRRNAPVASGWRRNDRGWRALLIVFAVAAAYANTLSAPFLFDDENSIVGNASIRQIATSLAPPRDTPVAGRPLVNLSFALNYRAGGLEVRGYHLVNIAIHIAAALVLFGLVRRTLLLPTLADRFGRASSTLGLSCALVWALHPLQTETVNYLTQRTESLMSLFYLLTLYAIARDSRLWRGVAICACAAGMACKESMVTAPVMVVLYDRVFVFESLRTAFRVRRGLYAGLAAGWLVLIALMAAAPRTSVGFAAGTSSWVYLLNQAELVARYLWLTIWPRALVLDYGLPRPLTVGDVVVPGAIVVFLIAATILALRSAPRLGFLGAWFFITLAPTSSVVPIATEVGAERRMYLALAAVVVAVMVGLHWIVSRGLPDVTSGAGLYGPRGGPQGSAPHLRGLLIVAAAVCLLLGAGTILRNQEYESRLAMATTIVERRPHGRAYFLLGNELIAAGRRDEAMTALRLSARDYPGAHYALGTELLGAGRIDEGITELHTFLRALPMHPTAAPARDMLGQAYLAQARFAEAAEQFRYLQEQVPSYRGARNDVLVNLGSALAGSGRLLEAVAVLERAVESNPQDRAARDLLGRVRAEAAAPLTNRRN